MNGEDLPPARRDRIRCCAAGDLKDSAGIRRVRPSGRAGRRRVGAEEGNAPKASKAPRDSASSAALPDPGGPQRPVVIASNLTEDDEGYLNPLPPARRNRRRRRPAHGHAG